jgi:hypothetical protein
MKLSDVMSAMGLSAYAELSLLLFVGVFLGVTLHVLAVGRRYEALGLLPLDEPRRRSREGGEQP